MSSSKARFGQGGGGHKTGKSVSGAVVPGIDIVVVVVRS